MIGPLQERRRDRQPKGLGGLEVDEEFELLRLLDGEVSGLGAAQDLVHECRCSPVQIGDVYAVGHQAPEGHSFAVHENRGNPMARCQIDDGAKVSEDQRGPLNKDSLGALSDEYCERVTEVVCLPSLYLLVGQAKRLGGYRGGVSIGTDSWETRIDENGNTRKVWDHVSQELDVLADNLHGGGPRQPSEVPSGPSNTGDESGSNGIDRVDHHDRN